MTTVMLPVDIGDVPVVMQALRDRMATIAMIRASLGAGEAGTLASTRARARSSVPLVW